MATDDGFVRRALTAIALAILAVAVVSVLVLGLRVLLLAFAGVLLAIFLRSLALGLARITRLPIGVALAVVVLALAGAVVAFGAWAAPTLVEQVQQLSQRIPQSIDKLRHQLEQHGWGRWALSNLPSGDVPQGGLLGKVATVVSTTIDNAVNVLVVGFVGLYVAASPRRYLNGLLRLVPKPDRKRATEVVGEIGYELRWWLIGQVFAMLLIAVLVTAGLWILGLPMALLLGVIAGLLNFIPNFGPVISAVPAVLIALTDHPRQALWVIAVYVVAQTIETYGVTPMVQQRNVDLPAALTLVGQVLLGLLAGAVGVTLAPPVLVVVCVTVKMLYVEDALGDRLELPGEDAGAAAPASPA